MWYRVLRHQRVNIFIRLRDRVTVKTRQWVKYMSTTSNVMNREVDSSSDEWGVCRHCYYTPSLSAEICTFWKVVQPLLLVLLYFFRANAISNLVLSGLRFPDLHSCGVCLLCFALDKTPTTASLISSWHCHRSAISGLNNDSSDSDNESQLFVIL